MSPDPVFFSDGYTRDGYVAASPGIHGAVAFTYRPATPEEREKSLRDKPNEPAAETVKRVAHLLTRKVLSWDVRNGDDAVPITEAMLARMPPGIVLRMHLMVVGIIPSDDKPDGPSGAEESSADAKN